MSSIMKSKIRIALCVISLVCCIMIISFSVAYLTSLTESEVKYTVGDVNVDLQIYFVSDNGETIDYNEYYYECVDPNGDSNKKMGVFKVDISDEDAKNFADKLRVDLVVKSNVDTYVRIAPYEQLTLTYQLNDITKEIAVVQEESTKFNYQFTDTSFYDNRDKDGYIYFRSPVKKDEGQAETVYPLIDEFEEGQTFGKSDKSYSLQIGFIVESVQALEGPEKNWGMSSAPWGGDW